MTINLLRAGKAAASLALIVLISGLIGCGDDPTDTNQIVTLTGDTKSVAGGTVRSWVQIDENDDPVAVGATFSREALEGLKDDETGFTMELALPEEASATAYESLGLRWKPQGSRLPPYDHPFLDVDFFEVTDAERAAMTPADSLLSYKQPDPEYLVDGYVLRNGLNGGTRVYTPEWGTPSSDTTTKEFNGGIFDQALVYYYFNGFISLSVIKMSLDYLESEPTLEAAIKQPQKYNKSNVYYASTYKISYSDGNGELTVELTGMVRR